MFEILKDPRHRQERLFLFFGLPILLAVSGGTLFFLLKGNVLDQTQTRKTVSSTTLEAPIEAAATPIPEPAPTPTPLPAPTPSAYVRGMQALQDGDRTSARMLLNEALESGEDKASVLNALGTMETMEKQQKEAIAHFSEAIKIDPKNTAYLMNRSEVLRQAGRYKEALADLRKAQDMDRLNPAYSNKILLTRLEAGESEQVIQEVQATINLNVKAYNADWLGGAAGIEFQAGNIDRGVDFLKELRTLVPAFTFKLIITDRCFEPYVSNPRFARLLSDEGESN